MTHDAAGKIGVRYFRFTERALGALELAPEGYYDVRDESRPWWVCRVGKRTRTLYVARKRHGGGQLAWVRLGQVGDKPLEQYRQQAETAAAALANGEDPTAQKPKRGALTLQRAVDDYLAAKPKLRPATIKSYKNDLHEMFGSYLVRPFTALDPATVQRLHQERSKVSPQRADGGLRVLRAVHRYARTRAEADNVKLELRDPLALIKAADAMNGPSPRDGKLEDAERRQWLRAVLALKDDKGTSLSGTQRDALLLLAATGMRLREALHLTWDEVDLQSGTITLSPARMKGGRKHVLPLGPRMWAMLKARHEKADGSTFVFANGDAPLDRISIHVLNRIGVEFSPHDLRRTIATWLGENAPGYVVKRILSHANPARSRDITDHYVKVKPEVLRHWLTQWEAVLYGRKEKRP